MEIYVDATFWHIGLWPFTNFSCMVREPNRSTDSHATAPLKFNLGFDSPKLNGSGHVRLVR
jgi:hypothetical protein